MSKHKLSGAFSSAVRTVTHTTNTVGNLASACDALSQNAEVNAYLSVAQSSLELCTELGIKPVDAEGKAVEGNLDALGALSAVKSLMVSLRGY